MCLPFDQRLEKHLLYTISDINSDAERNLLIDVNKGVLLLRAIFGQTVGYMGQTDNVARFDVAIISLFNLFLCFTL